jgi:hypothetical protein
MRHRLLLMLVAALLSWPVSVDTQSAGADGVLEVTVEDRRDGTAVTRHHVRTTDGRVELLFEDGEPGLRHGQLVRARGVREGLALRVSRGGVTPDGPEPEALTTGAIRTLVILMNFSGNQSQPENWSAVHALTFGPVSDFWRENSYGATWLVGDVTPYVTIPSTAGCDYSAWSVYANQEAAEIGYTGTYDRRVYVFHGVGACSWWGL